MFLCVSFEAENEPLGTCFMNASFFLFIYFFSLSLSPPPPCFWGGGVHSTGRMF
jgi:hypothetical protein